MRGKTGTRRACVFPCAILFKGHGSFFIQTLSPARFRVIYVCDTLLGAAEFRGCIYPFGLLSRLIKYFLDECPQYARERGRRTALVKFERFIS